nr:hypothetical protein P5668_11570 [Bacillus subtilis]
MDDIANVFQYYAGLADKDGGEIISSPIPDSESKIIREPIGVCGTRSLHGIIRSFKRAGKSPLHWYRRKHNRHEAE